MDRCALLDTVLDRELRADARTAALSAMSRQFGQASGPLEQQALRMQLLLAGRIAESRGSASVAADLTALAIKDASWLVTNTALEASEALDVPLRVTVRDGPPVEAGIEASLEKLNLPVGADLETKYRFTALKHGTDVVVVTLAPTTWTSARRFHAAVQRDPAWATKLPDGRCTKPVPFGDQLLPGIAVVHAIILSSDRQVIAAQRSRETSYAPLHWSVSFEEQLSEQDFGHAEDAFTAAARRGFEEEFGADGLALEVTPVASVMQVDLLNLGIVMVLRAAMTAGEIRDSWHSSARDGWEATDVRFLRLDDLAAAAASLGPRMHPTSTLRCLALRRWLSSS
jgi:hypothetical protein